MCVCGGGGVGGGFGYVYTLPLMTIMCMRVALEMGCSHSVFNPRRPCETNLTVGTVN